MHSGHEHISLVFSNIFWDLFEKFSQHKIVNGKKDPCAMFGCNTGNVHLFPEKYTVKDHISNTKLGKGDHYYIQTWHKDLFSHNNLVPRKL